MKRLAWLVSLCFVLVNFAVADEITFSFVFGAPGSFSADPSGVMLGPAINVLVTDSTKGSQLFLSGLVTAQTGAASSFTVSPGVVTATFNAGGAQSVLITSGALTVLSGVMEADTSLLGDYPGGVGAFLGTFTVTSVDPSVLAMFGLGPKFAPEGSFSSTMSNLNLVGPDTMVGRVAGGTVTIATPVDEPQGLALAGVGVLTLLAAFRRIDKTT